MRQSPSPSPEQLLAMLEAVIKEAPPLRYEVPLTEGDLRWLGRAEALIEASGAIVALGQFRAARSNLGSYMHSVSDVLAPLHNAYCRVELAAPQALRGAFIPAGETWNGYAALVKLIQKECDDLLLVDPYLSADFFIDLAPHCSARGGVRCLATQRKEYHPALSAAASKWSADPISSDKAIAVRYASSGSLHDRLIIIDRKEAWLITQSFKDVARRSPASVSRAEPEVGRLKAEHYDALWEHSDPIR
ncbi:MAG: hypothetical protein EON86_00355 [Brevundimonas sp.]|nr:MAG: hypothetical protein EON86_00355 [Brevundimonas sp.]